MSSNEREGERGAKWKKQQPWQKRERERSFFLWQFKRTINENEINRVYKHGHYLVEVVHNNNFFFLLLFDKFEEDEEKVQWLLVDLKNFYY